MPLGGERSFLGRMRRRRRPRSTSNGNSRIAHCRRRRRHHRCRPRRQTLWVKWEIVPTVEETIDGVHRILDVRCDYTLPSLADAAAVTLFRC